MGGREGIGVESTERNKPAGAHADRSDPLGGPLRSRAAELPPRGTRSDARNLCVWSALPTHSRGCAPTAGQTLLCGDTFCPRNPNMATSDPQLYTPTVRSSSDPPTALQVLHPSWPRPHPPASFQLPTLGSPLHLPPPSPRPLLDAPPPERLDTRLLRPLPAGFAHPMESRTGLSTRSSLPSAFWIPPQLNLHFFEEVLPNSSLC
ncbi:pectinesterase inhibitor 10-like isoform X2 [Vulpes lagopus]|uniref:pectinesterase inhibitor 10-like isoform X2 n=1 Tax=Vulpes lagopus TaxID=494514 RepID=UPI001BCA06BF|nr:pectinesterase inhibitor 10-like isoform X2 [Vulpes lagopus]